MVFTGNGCVGNATVTGGGCGCGICSCCTGFGPSASVDGEEWMADKTGTCSFGGNITGRGGCGFGSGASGTTITSGSLQYLHSKMVAVAPTVKTTTDPSRMIEGMIQLIEFDVSIIKPSHAAPFHSVLYIPKLLSLEH